MPLSAGKKCCGHDKVFSFDRLFVILADNKDSPAHANVYTAEIRLNTPECVIMDIPVSKQ